MEVRQGHGGRRVRRKSFHLGAAYLVRSNCRNLYDTFPHIFVEEELQFGPMTGEEQWQVRPHGRLQQLQIRPRDGDGNFRFGTGYLNIGDSSRSICRKFDEEQLQIRSHDWRAVMDSEYLQKSICRFGTPESGAYLVLSGSRFGPIHRQWQVRSHVW
jgi:hypothetical protein